MTPSIWDVAVIGAGLTGSALTIQLARRMPAGSRILLIGSPKEIGHGLAYGTTNPNHLLNVRAKRMSLDPEDDDQFVEWLAERPQCDEIPSRAALDEAYVSRSAYGDYVRSALLKAITNAKRRLILTVIEGTAVSLRPDERGFAIRLASGERFRAASAALCLGHAPGRFPISVNAIDAAAKERLIADPWGDYRLNRIAADASVLFVGTGLTMIDQVLTLHRAGHTGPMTAVSRHGLLPAAHADTRAEPRRPEIAEGERGLGRLFRSVVGAARREEAGGGDWRAVIDGLRPITQTLWQGLSPADRRRFGRHLAALWSTHRHRMAPAVAGTIERLRSEGRLAVRAARLIAIRQRVERPIAVLQARSTSTIEVKPFDWIVNCSGVGGFAATAEQPLIAELLTQGIVRPDPLRLGLDVTPACALVGREGAPSSRLLALGPLTAGRFFEITAVPDIKHQCAEIAEALAGIAASRGRPTGLMPARVAAGGRKAPFGR
jgi:uncharacterized NAD(P)/FAD-binding protein YdhS